MSDFLAIRSDTKECHRNLYDGLNDLPDTVLHLDRHLKVLWANKIAQEKYPEIQGRKCYEIIAGRNAVCFGCPSYKALKTGESQVGFQYFEHGENRNNELYLKKISIPLQNTMGDIGDVLDISKDLTNQKEKFNTSPQSISSKLINQLGTADQILPICSYCGNARDSDGNWFETDEETLQKFNGFLSHGICPHCVTEWRKKENL